VQDRVRALDAAEAVPAAVEHEPDAVTAADERPQLGQRRSRVLELRVATRFEDADQIRYMHKVLLGAVLQNTMQSLRHDRSVTLLASEKRETLYWLEYDVLHLFSEALGRR
jgi:hypothetical protein